MDSAFFLYGKKLLKYKVKQKKKEHFHIPSNKSPNLSPIKPTLSTFPPILGTRDPLPFAVFWTPPRLPSLHLSLIALLAYSPHSVPVSPSLQDHSPSAADKPWNLSGWKSKILSLPVTPHRLSGYQPISLLFYYKTCWKISLCSLLHFLISYSLLGLL